MSRVAGLALVLALLACSPDAERPGDEGSGTAQPSGARQQAPGKQGKPKPIEFTVGDKAGRWHEFRTHQFDSDLTDEQREQFTQLEQIGYAAGVHKGDFPRGVTQRDSERMAPGLNLLTSAHEAGALLIDAQGKVLHRWSYRFDDVWPDYPGQRDNTAFWRRAHLFENGDVLALYEGLGLIKVDKDSTLLWSSTVRAHHELVPAADGGVWVLSREARVLPRIHARRPVLEDFLSLLDAEGKELRRVSILEALENSDYSEHWNGELTGDGDIFHTNSLQLLDGRLADVHPAFAAGNFLVSMLKLNLIAVLDPEAERIVWAMTGSFRRQHDPGELANGRLLLFDNNPRAEASRILELDPATGEERLVYEGSESSPFFSATCGVAQRLPGGNTLVTESDYGRAFEITRDGSIVWEYYSPFRAGEGGRYIATMMEMQRLPPGFPVGWASPK